MIDQLNELRERALTELVATSDVASLEEWRVRFLGKKGALTALLRGLGQLPPPERPAAGQAANAVKQRLEEALETHARTLSAASLQSVLERERIDVTLPGRPMALGHEHPTTRVLREMADIFVSMGFQIVEGPEVEWDYYNFEALNIPVDHPAREMWDTFYVSPPDMILRTHTSPVQIRVMEQSQPPVRIMAPGRCYRYEATDASHESMFFQVEGLAVDTGITMADLKGTLISFAHRMFGEECRVRFRCDYFPFVEPGVEMAIDCFVCHGAGCRLCKMSGWLEILGAGMVHPQVLKNVGYDPAKFTGFAFGIGPERVAMLKYGIDDIRLFYANDLRFLHQFS